MVYTCQKNFVVTQENMWSSMPPGEPDLFVQVVEELELAVPCADEERVDGEEVVERRGAALLDADDESFRESLPPPLRALHSLSR